MNATTKENTPVKHTPGPWAFNENKFSNIPFDVHGVIADCPCATWVCSVLDAQVDRDTAKANARLIAAAPELLEALRRTTKAIRDIQDNRILFADELVALEFGEAILAKATGAELTPATNLSATV